MKRLLFTTISILINFSVFGQAEKADKKLMPQIADLYNRGEFRQIYNLMSAGFKAEISEAQMVDFYQHTLRDPMGKIVSWSPQADVGSEGKYLVEFDNGRLDLVYYLDAQNKLTGIQWLPAKEAAAPKKKVAGAMPNNNPKQTGLQKLVDSLAVDYLGHTATCGLVIGVIKGDSLETFSYGSEDKEVARLTTPETMYEIGSVTKTFTGILLAHAISDGKIKADDDIRKYLPHQYPNLQFDGSPVTVVELSNHTSGLPRIPADLEQQPRYNDQNPYKNYSKDMVYNYLGSVTLSRKPGTAMEYSNLGVTVLGLILENVYQKPLADLVRENITGPLQMMHTTFSVSPAEKAKMATGYGEGNGKKVPCWDLEVFNACGGLKSNMSDMLKYLRANMNEINGDYRLAHTQTHDGRDMAVGLNWMLSPAKGTTFVWHNGGTAGFRSFCGYLKGKNVGVVLLSNAAVDLDYVALGILLGAAAE